MGKKVIIYCDRCAANHGLPITETKQVKGTCQLCNLFIGPLNEEIEETVIPNHTNTESIKVGAFQVEQLPNFIVGQSPKDIHRTLPYDIKSQDLVIYFPSISDDPKGRKTIIIANPLRGEQIKIVLPGKRKTNSTITVNAE